MTVALGVGIVGIPLVDSCASDARGLLACLREMASRKFELPGDPAPPPRAAETVPDAPIVVSAPAEPAGTPTPPTPPMAPTEPPAETSPAIADTGPGEGGPLLAPQPAAPAIVPAMPVPPAPPQVQRQAAVDDAVVTPAAVPTAPDEPPQVDAMVMAPISDHPPQPGAALHPEFPQPPRPALPTAPVPAAASPAEQPVAASEGADKQLTVAASEVPPPAAGPAPTIAAPLALAPTIDAIELEGDASYISGSGPAGAVVRLYSDGKLLGESKVEEGRWVIEAGTILDQPRTELRAEAVEPDTGKMIGDSIITVEITLPEDKPTEPGNATTPPPSDQAAPVVPPARETTTPPVTQQAPPATEPESPPAAPVPPTAAPEEPEPAALPESSVGAPSAVPPLAPITPDRGSASVEILPAPALVAEFTLPEPPKPSPSVTVMHLFPFGDPVYGRFSGGKAIIRRGDTLWTLARRYYGAGIHYRTIVKANRDQIRRPSRIYPGQVFDLPIVTEE